MGLSDSKEQDVSTQLFTCAVNSAKYCLNAREIKTTGVSTIHPGCVSHVVYMKNKKMLVYKVNRKRFIHDLAESKSAAEFPWHKYNPVPPVEVIP